MRRTLLGVIIGYIGVVGTAGAQASAYLSLDDPRGALLEHLIARGDVADPTPMFRPWRRLDLVGSLTAAKLAPASVGGRMVIGLAQGLAEGRDWLQPAGSGGVWPLGEAAVRAHCGPVAVAVRSTFEPLALAAFGGLQHTRNADHLSGRMRTRFEGRFQATMGFTLGGRVR